MSINDLPPTDHSSFSDFSDYSSVPKFIHDQAEKYLSELQNNPSPSQELINEATSLVLDVTGNLPPDIGSFGKYEALIAALGAITQLPVD